MAKELDVYQFIKSFSTKNKLSIIEYSIFSLAIQRQARNYDQKEPFFRDLSINPDTILVPRLFQLSKEGRISIQTVNNRIDRIFLPEAFTETVYREYKRIEDNPDIPFPDEDSLGISVPMEWIQAVSVEADLPSILTQNADKTVPLYRLVFPDSNKNMVILSIMVLDKLLDYSILKIRNYLRKGSNKDYIQQRMVAAFSGKDNLLKDNLTSIMIRPFEAAEELRNNTGAFSYSFWAYLTTSIRKDLSGKSDPMPDDIAANQASYILDVYNNHYKNKAQHEIDRNEAFNTLAQTLKKPPYLYSLDDISNFRDSQGRPLLGKYTKEELETWLKDKTSQTTEERLPELLLLTSGYAKGNIIAKETMIPYLVNSLKENRSVIKTMIIRDWREIMEEFRTIPAMEDDKAFIADLDKKLEANAPSLFSILLTSLPGLVYQELRPAKETSAELERCFGAENTSSTDVLLNLNRKHMYMDVKVMMPIWYSIPILSWILKLFLKPRDKKQNPQTKTSKNRVNTQQEVQRPENTRAIEFSQMARAAEKRLLSTGQSLEDRMINLNVRWNTLIEAQAKANLTEDIHSLVRDYLRNALRTMRPSSFTLERIEAMAATIADRPNLLKIRNHQALEEYIKLYIIKLLKK